MIKQLNSLLIILALILLAFSCVDDNKLNNSKLISKDTSEETRNCLINCDWVYPSSSNPLSAWKFSSDRTFNSSTTMFGGMSTWGNWTIVSPGKINISYIRTTEGIIPDDQVLTMNSCSRLKVGSTFYIKD